MITDSIEYEDVENLKNVLSSPVDSPRGECGDAVCGLSATRSERSSQPSSWSSRYDSPSRKSSCGLSSYMPIVDEEVGSAANSPHGTTSWPEEEQQPALPAARVEAFHNADYVRQVRRWQQVENFYMKHDGWCEHRVIVLLQEAFRCSYANLKDARDEGSISHEVFAARAAELRNSLMAIKKEYRRTLERTKERSGDLSGIASKAVTCIASVYPWSSEGFVLGFEENLKYGDVSGIAKCSAHRGAPLGSPMFGDNATANAASSPSTTAVLLPKLEPESAERDYDEGEDLGIPESVVAGGRSRRVATPRVTLMPLPPRRQLFQEKITKITATSNATTAEDGSPTVWPAHSSAPVAASFLFAFPQPDSQVRGATASPPPSGGRCSPVPVPPPHIAGPLRAGEMRFLEKRQLILQGMAFVSRSLASSSFIASRRAAIAAATMRLRLEQVKEKEDGKSGSQVASLLGSCMLGLETHPQQQQQRPCSPLLTAPILPTRYMIDVSPTPNEAAVFDSNPSSGTRHSSPGGAHNRHTRGNPTLCSDGGVAGEARSLPSSITKRAMGMTNTGTSNNALFQNSIPYNESTNNSGPMRSLPHSYTARNRSGPAVIQSQPRSYTSRCVSTQPGNADIASATSAPLSRVAAPCPVFRVDVPERLVLPAAPPTYGQDTPVTSGYSAIHTVAADLAAVVRAAPAPLPPCYTSHIRRDRIRMLPSRSCAPYSGIPPVSVVDEQNLKELW
ncbi:hypothetical protein ABL78_2605 [Leptomonas seymouri]|uniref:Ch28 protein n=1 Tax=Leptomonas seymouri TaxID=5684 RepID=A0A0N0P724_LEPSE|nr:hypothetical protein ABL78_2605 [Leptomonas seymouri]|eukprot:KPI88306.1 hypothetical protein ABL78_2605 [Leptomonas seymouri]